MHKRRILIDVDGVVADLMGGFSDFLKERFGVDLPKEKVTKSQIWRSTELVEEYKRSYGIDLLLQLEMFLACHDVYEQYIRPIEGSCEALRWIDGQECFDAAFLTATLEEAPQSYASKHRWLRKHYPKFPVISCPAKRKHWVPADFLVEDRWDTCERWRDAVHGIGRPLLFGQPWNEAPPEVIRYDWTHIVSELYYSTEEGE